MCDSTTFNQPDTRNPSLYLCVCNGGFSGDGFVCTPEENCQNTPSLCHLDAKCMSTTSGLQCVCNAGKMVCSSYLPFSPTLSAS